MLEIINNVLSKKDYYVCLYQNHLYIYQYNEIISFNHDLIIIKFIDFNLKVRGAQMFIKRLHEHELLIEGQISGVFYE